MNNEIFFWGRGSFLLESQKPSEKYKKSPTKLKIIPEEYEIEEIKMGNYGTLILTKEGEIIQFINNSKNEYLPVKKAIQISVGYGNYSYLTENGEVYAKGESIDENKINEIINISSLLVKPDEKVVNICCGVSSVYFLTDKQIAYGIGSNKYGQLGSAPSQDRVEMKKIKSKISRIFSGNYSFGFFCIDLEDNIFACGKNGTGELGIERKNDSIKSLTKVDLKDKGKVEKIVGAYQHSLILLKIGDQGCLYSSGYSSCHGHLNTGDISTFTKIAFFENQDVVQVDAGCYHTIAMTREGKIYGWGLNPSGQLGIGSFTSQNVPTQLILPELTFPIENYYISTGAFNGIFYYVSQSSLRNEFFRFFETKEGFDVELATNTYKKPVSAHNVYLQFIFGKNFPKFKQYLSTQSFENAYSFVKFLYGNSDLKIDMNHKLIFEELMQEKPPNLIVESTVEKMFRDEESKDFTIISQSKFFKVHKIILWARSQLFRGMFLNVVDDSGQVHDYSEISHNSLQIMIDYLYTNQINSDLNEEIIEELTKAMDFFQLDEREPNIVTKAKSKFQKQNL
ncbi:hypothetical protein M0811_10877 [Anaeramoeba ignava]|uniref:BTB domain-containing protein n=1 Tax=Anaeramoeba ignava TaxID=1746090 RepID=A0A9Q0LDF3_ANAIG|nr:hypothetical protein M0811_10877 [Anaeramoeba ignava]